MCLWSNWPILSALFPHTFSIWYPNLWNVLVSIPTNEGWEKCGAWVLGGCQLWFQSQCEIHGSICLSGNRIISFCVTISFQLGRSFFFFYFSLSFYRTFHFLLFFFSLLPQLDLAICSKPKRKLKETVSLESDLLAQQQLCRYTS